MHPWHETRGARAPDDDNDEPIEARRAFIGGLGGGLGGGLSLISLIALMSLTGLVGCSSAPKLTSISGNVVAASDLNPSVTQQPRPLVLRVYELKSAAAFSQAEYMALFASDAAALGAEMVAREELTLQPGETRPLNNKPLNANTRFIGVFAAYRLLDKARWRAVLPVQPGQAQKLTIRADALAVSIQAVP
jgi:type VI secretion system protein VasD